MPQLMPTYILSNKLNSKGLVALPMVTLEKTGVAEVGELVMPLFAIITPLPFNVLYGAFSGAGVNPIISYGEASGFAGADMPFKVLANTQKPGVAVRVRQVNTQPSIKYGDNPPEFSI